jgi:Leucine-rich repeat (LRR) protein/putative cell wall-binding protein
VDLHDNGLSGPIPGDIGNLVKTTFLDLGKNHLTGAIPVEIGQMSSLIVLRLSENRLTAIPHEINSLEGTLHWLYVADNLITTIPPEIGNLAALEWLDLGNNRITSVPPMIGNLHSLTTLDLRGNDLASVPPEIGDLGVLESLDLSGNELTTTPTGFGSLTSVSFSWNRITGDITPTIGDLLTQNPGITTMYLSDGPGHNNCMTATSPAVIERLSSLDPDWQDCTTCEIQSTTVPSGAVQQECDALVALYSSTDGPNWTVQGGWNTPVDPCTWNGVTCDTTGVAKLDVGGNNLAGPVPTQIGALTAVTELNLGNNHISSIPDEIGNMSSLERLWLDANPLPELPAGIGNLSNLVELSIIQGQLTALPPEIGKLTKLEAIDLSGNYVKHLPVEFGDLASLTVATIWANRLSGDITQQMAGVKDTLHVLRLADGSGFNTCLSVTDPTLAAWLTEKDPGWDECSGCTIDGTPVASIATHGECDALVALYDATDGPNWKDHSGWKTKTDPCTWHGVTCNYVGVSGVSMLDLKDNLLDGAVPADIDGLVNLVLADFDDNHLTSLPSQIGSLPKLDTLLVHANSMTSLPPEIGNLSNLRNLDISDMNLMSLPATFANLGKFDVLIAYRNHFTTIPDWIGNLPLSSLHLSYNQLTGDITTPMSGIRDTAVQLYLSDGPGGNSCLTVTDPALGWWLSAMDRYWDECPATTPGVDVVVVGGSAAVPDSVLTKLGTLTTGTVTRLFGANRYATAAAVSAANFPSGVSAAFIATANNFPDALSAGPVAGREGAPILLTGKAALPPETVQELIRLKPERIVVVGGTAVVSNTVMSQLAAYTAGSVTRVAGANRYATAAAMSASAFDPGVGTVLVATGANFPDALAGGPAGVMWDGPVLLTQQNAIPASTMAELQRLHPGRIVVLGGTGAVSSGVAGQLASLTSGPVLRYAGANRYATAAAISKAVFVSGSGTVFVSTGTNYPDAVAAGSAAGMLHAPILLVDGSMSVPQPTSTEVQRLGS